MYKVSVRTGGNGKSFTIEFEKEGAQMLMDILKTFLFAHNQKTEPLLNKAIICANQIVKALEPHLSK